MSDIVLKGKVLDFIFKGLAALAPLTLAWVIRLEVTNAIQNERIQELQQSVQRQGAIAVQTQQNTTMLVKLETKLDAITKNIDEIKRLLSTP